MRVCFDREELNTFNLEELKKMLDIQIKYEKFEGAIIIRDIIEEKKNKFGLGNYQNNDDDDDDDDYEKG